MVLNFKNTMHIWTIPLIKLEKELENLRKTK